MIEVLFKISITSEKEFGGGLERARGAEVEGWNRV